MADQGFKSTSLPEQRALQHSGYEFIYQDTEKIPVVEVDNVPLLGKLAALRFLEWVQTHPGGVISLPAGQSSDYFISWVQYYWVHWNKTDVQRDLALNGLDPEHKPRMQSLHFVQMSEFYPIHPDQENSFYYFVHTHYIEGFGLDPRKALLMDCYNLGIPNHMSVEQVFPNSKVDLTLRSRQPENKQERLRKQVIERIDQFCTDYETRIRDLGGIGFFLGGIGPDGHAAFNIRGSDFYSTTRLTPANYETQAAAASALGGIEVARNRLVITIGLSTLTYCRDAAAIIIAAGEAKAQTVAGAVEHEPSNQYPATVLQRLPHARFYLTHGAASCLKERRYVDLHTSGTITREQIEEVIIDLAASKRKRIRDLNEADVQSDRFAALLLQRTRQAFDDLKSGVEQHLIEKIAAGTREIHGKTFMHTAPHHDDIMLGYLPYIYHLVRSPENTHYFNYMTSGFHAVTNQYMLDLLQSLSAYMRTPDYERRAAEQYFTNHNPIYRHRDVYHYLDGVAGHHQTLKREAVSRRLLRNLNQLYGEDIPQLRRRINELKAYFQSAYPGKTDPEPVQKLKGMIREWEADLLWAHLGFDSRSVNHLRLGFYQDDVFAREPDMERDVQPILDLLRQIQPDVMTVAFDPEGSGPDTHYKVLQAAAIALRRYEKKDRKNIEIWGYRNVWYRFHPSEADVFVPVSLNSLAILENTFYNAFGSQRNASFPSPELDGPFSRLAQRIQAEQFYTLKTCLGQDFFNENQHPRIRAMHGLCYIKTMNIDEFCRQTSTLKQRMQFKDAPN
ncbi:MAG: glucosamine-6-phosphate deaminase [candidate division KSB1 bacterium]|nr:glucosamine-6-phosphate deaminase [candidate division KSB1 bacterium]